MLLLFAGVMHAQPKIDFSRVINNWPTIELWFSITCDGSPKGTQNKSFFRVKQNRVDVSDFELWCPLGQFRNENSEQQLMNRAGFRCGVTASLVLDVRAAMAGNYLTSAKAGANSFINQLDGVIDEATIIAFHSYSWVVQSMTTIKTLHYNAINSLQAGAGSGSVWDGIFTGLTELIANGVNPCRGVVVLSGGPSTGGSG